jgi:hypothetical protein
MIGHGMFFDNLSLHENMTGKQTFSLILLAGLEFYIKLYIGAIILMNVYRIKYVF